ncbi:MAG: hypothetical protein HQK67_12550 [Desulfamplus sp.]|nr:hypothetical protein [Desulfamplus sp.]
MNIEIKIEIDKETSQLIQTKFDKVAEKIIGIVNIIEKFTVKTEDIKSEASSSKDKEKTSVKSSIQDGGTSFSENIAEKTIDIKPELKSEPKPELKSKSDLKSEPKPELKSKSDLKSESKPELKSKSELKSEPKPELKSKSELKFESKPELKSKSELEAPEQIKVKKTRKSSVSDKKPKTTLEVVLNVIKKSNGGINVDDLKKQTGFNAKKVADAVYNLKKNGKIQKTDDNLYIAVE